MAQGATIPRFLNSLDEKNSLESCVSQEIFVPLYRRRTSIITMQTGNLNSQFSIFNSQSLGRSELAQRYFPNIQPMSAWLKLKSLLQENPDLAPLAQLNRRTFLPAEVNKIYQVLGQP